MPQGQLWTIDQRSLMHNNNYHWICSSLTYRPLRALYKGWILQLRRPRNSIWSSNVSIHMQHLHRMSLPLQVSIQTLSFNSEKTVYLQYLNTKFNKCLEVSVLQNIYPNCLICVYNVRKNFSSSCFLASTIDCGKTVFSANIFLFKNVTVF